MVLHQAAQSYSLYLRLLAPPCRSLDSALLRPSSSNRPLPGRSGALYPVGKTLHADWTTHGAPAVEYRNGLAG